MILDTCVWVDLVVSEFSLVAKLARLIDDAKIAIVIPDLIRAEWDGCKRKIETQIANEVVEARRFAMRFVSFMDEIEPNDVSAQVSSADPISMGRRIAAQRIAALEAILNSEATICVPVSAQAETLAIKHALGKMAPFRMRNSMADALIFLAAVEWVNDQKPAHAVFVTHNTKDFSDEKRGDDDVSFKERLALDLQPLVETNGMTFCPVIGRVLNDVEQSVATEAEVERGEAVVTRTRLKDDALEELMSGEVIAKLLAEHKKFEEMASGGAVAKILARQKEIEQLASGGAIGEILEQQRRFEEMASGGVFAKVMKQQTVAELASSGAIEKMLEQQKKFAEVTSSGAFAKVVEQTKRIKEMASGGAIGKLLDQQRRVETMAADSAISKILEEQRKIEEMVNGGAVGRLLKEQRKIEAMLRRFQ